MAADTQTGLIRFIFRIRAFLGSECGQMARCKLWNLSIINLALKFAACYFGQHIARGLCMRCVFPITLALLCAALCPCVCLQEQVATGSFLSKHTPLNAYSQTHSISVLFPVCTSTSSFLVEIMGRMIKKWRRWQKRKLE